MFGHNQQLEPFKFDIYEVSEISNKEYHSRKEISSSFVKTVCKHSVGKALAPQPEETPEYFLFGDAFHEYMEKGALSDRFVVKPAGKEGDGRTKEGKEWAAENAHKIVMKPTDIESIKGMRDSIFNLPFIKRIHSNPDFEVRDEWSFFAEGDDKFTKGVNFRVRPDRHLVRDGSKIEYIIDWKSCMSLESLIRWDFIKLHYDVQAVFYSDILGVDPRHFLFACAEKSYPYSARLIRLSDDSIEKARLKMASAIHKIREWQADPNDPKLIDIDLPELIEI
jgi:hypothetical protein